MGRIQKVRARQAQRKQVLLLGVVAAFVVSATGGRGVFATAGLATSSSIGTARERYTLEGPAGPPVATLGSDLSLLENTHMIIKLDGFDPNPGAVVTGFIIYVSNAGTLFQVNPDGSRGALIGSVTPVLGVAATNNSQLIWYEPNPNFFGIDGFQYYLKDNLEGESFLRTVTITTHQINQAPTAVSTTHSGVAEAAITGIVLDASAPGPLQTMTGHITQFPNSGRLYRTVHATPADQLTPANPTFQGTQLFYISDRFPNPSTDAFSYFVTDGTLSSPTVTDLIVLQSVGSPPTTGSPPSIFATTENTPAQIALTPSDPSGPTASLQIELTNGPQNGSLCQVNLLNVCQPVTPGNDFIGPQSPGTWLVTYTPNSGFTSDGGSPDTFTYTLTSAEGITSGPFTVQIYVLGMTNPGNCPSISISPGTVPGGNLNSDYGPVAFTPSGGSGPYSISELGALPAGMTFADGVLSGTPTEAGDFSFVVVATDSNNCSATAAYEFAILDPPPGIVAGSPVTVKADGTVSLMTVASVSDSALSPATLSAQAVNPPAGVNVVGLNNSSGSITAYVGAACGTAAGPYSVTLQVSDGVTSEMTNLTVNVLAAATPPVTLSYPAVVTLSEGQTSIIRPKTSLTNGQIARALVTNNGAGGYNGTVSVDQGGAVTVSGVGPAGNTFIVDVSVILPCGAVQDVTFALVVSCASDDFSLLSSSQSFPKSGGTGTVGVSASGTCSWTAASNASWITITSGGSGSDDGVVSYSVAPTTTLRTGTMTIAGQTFSVSQACPAPSVTASPASQSVCVGSAANLSVLASGTNLTYQWRKNGVAMAGARSANLSIASVKASDAGQYDVVVSGDCGSVTSKAATLSISSPIVTSQPANQAAVVGGSATFSISVTSSISYTIQWQIGGGNGGFTNIPGATSATLTLSALTSAQSGNSYRAVISSTCGTVTTNSATLFVFGASGGSEL